MKINIGGYNYFDTQEEAQRSRRIGEVTAHEGGLGWYNYNVQEYKNNPRKRLFGF